MGEIADAGLDDALTILHAQMRACRRCLGHCHPILPPAVFSGPVTADVMIVGQAPGSTEVQAGRPFSGSSGRRLFAWLAQVGWTEEEFRATQYLTAVTKCYPGRAAGGKGDRVPTRAEQELCAPFLERELSIVCPKVVVPVGALAVRRFLGSVRLADVVGRVMCAQAGWWIVALPHPSGASLWLNQPRNREQVERALGLIRRLCDEMGLETKGADT